MDCDTYTFFKKTVIKPIKHALICIFCLQLISYPIILEATGTGITSELLFTVDELIKAAFALFPELKTSDQNPVVTIRNSSGLEIVINGTTPTPHAAVAATPEPSHTGSPYTHKALNATRAAAGAWPGLSDEEGSEDEDEASLTVTPEGLDTAQGGLAALITPTTSPMSVINCHYK